MARAHPPELKKYLSLLQDIYLLINNAYFLICSQSQFNTVHDNIVVIMKITFYFLM